MARICDLVEEVVEEIMSWLSPESLKRFKCVSKKCYAFINAVMRKLAFVAKRLENMKKKKLPFQSLRFSKPTADDCSEEGEERSAEEAHFLLIWANNDARDDFGMQDLKLPFGQTTLEKFHLTGHCNGIICLAGYDREGKILLLNPALREIKTLPSSCLGGEYEVREVGFGYDSGKNDCKVVVIRVFLDNFRAEVYTLSTNSWKEITLDAEFKLSLCHFGGAYRNGVCYWNYKDGEYNDAIHSFDCGNDVFQAHLCHIMSRRKHEFGQNLDFGIIPCSLVLFLKSLNGHGYVCNESLF